MHTTVKISADLSRAIMLRSFHQRNKPRVRPHTAVQRSEAVFGTKAYNDALQRAFNRAKTQVFFNPDMTQFITLTYRGADHTPEQVLRDVKVFLKRERRLADRSPDGQSGAKTPKYIYVMEYQKRGSIHVHMIANSFATTYRNKNGYLSLSHWPHGYSSVLTINDFDNNFRPHLYLFKYMKKAQRIGPSFLHSSKNLNNYTKLEESTIDLENWNTINMEYTHTTVETTNFSYFTNYLQSYDTINSQITNPPQKDITQCKTMVHLRSNKELQEILENHTRR